MKVKFAHNSKKMFKSLFLGISLSLLLFMFSCNKKEQNKPVYKKKVPVVEKKVVVKTVNPKTSLLKTKIDRTKTPYAGVWEPNDSDTGFLLIFPDGKFEMYGRFDKSCSKKPKKTGTYKVVGDKTIEFTINGKAKTVKLEVLSNFVKIDGFGLFWPPNGLALKAGQKEFVDPVKLVRFCRNVTEKSVSKIYPYLTKKSKLQLLKIGITGKNDFTVHYKFTNTIDKLLKDYKTISSITSIKKSGDDEVFKVVLKNRDGNTFGENITVSKEDNKLRCGFFNDMKLVSSRKNTKVFALWYKEMANTTTNYVFKSKEINTPGVAVTLNVQFDANNITVKKLNSSNKIIEEVKSEFKIIVNTPNVVAISLKGDKKDVDTKKGDNLKKEDEEILVFKFGVEEAVIIIYKDKKYMMLGK